MYIHIHIYTCKYIFHIPKIARLTSSECNQNTGVVRIVLYLKTNALSMYGFQNCVCLKCKRDCVLPHATGKSEGNDTQQLRIYTKTRARTHRYRI